MVLALIAGVVALAAPTAGAASGGATAVPNRVRISLGATQVVTDVKTAIHAVVLPRSAGAPIVLQRRGSTRWHNVATGRANGRGEVTFHVSFATEGTVKLRAVVLPGAPFSELVSPSAPLEVVNPPPPYAGPALSEGATGGRVYEFQEALSKLGYWVGTPNGYFGDATEQAIYALQKAANLNRSGVFDAATQAALAKGVVPTPRAAAGSLIEVDLKDDLVMWVDNGKVEHILNTSTGGGYTYTEDGETDVAITPTGVFHTQRVVDGTVTDTLGTLWRPRFFYEGYAIHGDTYVPPEPASHGCVRVSNEAIDWIWSANLDPIGTEVWVYN